MLRIEKFLIAFSLDTGGEGFIFIIVINNKYFGRSPHRMDSFDYRLNLRIHSFWFVHFSLFC